MSDLYPAIPPHHQLRDCPKQQVSISWPTPIDRRLDELVGLARDAARDTNRRELIAALVLAAPTDPTKLDEIVKRYRLAVALDALVRPEVVEDGNVLVLPKHRPGPR
jgi:hypothetical protein